MAISGVLVALVFAGVIPVVLFSGTPGAAFATLGIWLALCLLLVLVDLLAAAAPRQVAIERALPRRVRLGETAVSELLITNLGRRRLRAVVRDCWEPSAGGGVMRASLTLPAGERRSLRQMLTPWRRGDRRSDAVVIRSWGPMHLAARQAMLRSEGRLRVLPPFNSRKHLPSRLARLRELDGQTTLQVRGPGTEFDSLREYVRGDDVRSIDWRATARRRDLVVRTWHPERDRRVVIILDTGRGSAARIADETRLDTSIESTLLLAALATRAGDRVDLIAWDRRVRARVQGASGPELLSRLVDALAPVEPELLEPDWLGVPALVRGVTAHRALVVILTTAGSAGASRELLEMLPQLTRQHLVVVASVTDPETIELARSHTDAEAVYRAAAAERSLLDADRLRRGYASLGADSISAAPVDLPPRLADRYLELKRAGRL